MKFLEVSFDEILQEFRIKLLGENPKVFRKESLYDILKEWMEEFSLLELLKKKNSDRIPGEFS